MASIESWKTVRISKQLGTPIFRVDNAVRTNPHTGNNGTFVVLDTPQWVNIIPVTERGTVVFIRQYRHGTDSITLEIPGGMVEHGEDPCLAAMRECLEETGFSSPVNAEYLGKVHPNPAFMNNECLMYVWFGCALTGTPQFDTHEQIEWEEVPLNALHSLVADGSITHSLVLTALYYFALKYPHLAALPAQDANDGHHD